MLSTALSSFDDVCRLPIFSSDYSLPAFVLMYEGTVIMRNPPQATCLPIFIVAASLLLFASLPVEAAAGAATISWNPPTRNADGSQLGDLAGYRIYFGRKATRLDNSIEIDNPGLTRYMVEGLAPARWHFAMTSINSQGVESQRSKTVSKQVR